MSNTTDGPADRPAELESRLDDMVSDAEPVQPRENPDAEPYHDQQLGGVARTGDGPSLQEPSSAQGGG